MDSGTKTAGVSIRTGAGCSSAMISGLVNSSSSTERKKIAKYFNLHPKIIQTCKKLEIHTYVCVRIMLLGTLE